MGRNRELEFLLDSVSNRWDIFNSESEVPIKVKGREKS
jgi:hypothetical protein